MDYYKILDIEKTATSEEIKKAYRQKAMEFHPDRNPGDAEAIEKFKKVQEAYDILSDSFKRSNYDLGRNPSSHKSPPSGNPFHNDPFWNFVHNNNNRGRNLQTSIEISLEEAFVGVVKKIEIEKTRKCAECSGQGYTEFSACKKCSGSGKMYMKHMLPIMFQICDNCQGTGRAGTIPCNGCVGSGFFSTGKEAIDVQIPPGMDTGMQIRMNGKGEPSRTKGGPGDLYLVISIKEHSYMKRRERDIHVEIPLCYTELIKGTQITFKHLNGKDVKVTVPKNSKPDTQLRMKGMGMPEVITGRRGDIVVTLKCFVPNPVNAEHEELLRRLMEIETTLVPERNNFER